MVTSPTHPDTYLLWLAHPTAYLPARRTLTAAALVVLSTASHYLVDALAGLFVLLTGYAISRTAVRLGWLNRHQH